VNWTEIFLQIQAQSAVFWVAAVSITARATMLLNSMLVLAKRGLVRTISMSWRTNPRFKRTKGARKQTSAMVQKTETGYVAHSLNAMKQNSSPLEQSPAELQHLHDRLKKAANVLEDIHNSLKSQDDNGSGSALKVPGKDVEYVFKTGIA